MGLVFVGLFSLSLEVGFMCCLWLELVCFWFMVGATPTFGMCWFVILVCFLICFVLFWVSVYSLFWCLVFLFSVFGVSGICVLFRWILLWVLIGCWFRVSAGFTACRFGFCGFCILVVLIWDVGLVVCTVVLFDFVVVYCLFWFG